MPRPSTDTFPRPADLSARHDPVALYIRSYLLIRTVVGALGIVLPVALVGGDTWYRGGGLHLRASLSAYYHSPMQDVFVGVLCVVAFLLATYLAGEPWTWDFLLSLLAGLALLVVVFFPIDRADPRAAPCGGLPVPAGCSPVEHLLGEATTATVHEAAAAVCFLALAAVSLLFGRREHHHAGNRAAAGFHRACGLLIGAAVAGAAAGDALDLRIGPVTVLWLGEVVAVWAFGASWLLAGRELWIRLLRGRRR